MIRRLTAIVLTEQHFPIVENSKLDVAFLRMANNALQQKQNGMADSFLFVICGNISESDNQSIRFPHFIRDLACIDKYGFPEIEVVPIDTTDESGDELEHYDVQESIGTEISKWLKVKHPAAITAAGAEVIDGLDVWWSGIEAIPDEHAFPFDLEYFAKALPGSHKSKAATWLAILKELCSFENGESWILDNQFRMHAIALCEWLHGFEGASGNAYNDFDAGESGRAVEIDDFYLGCTWGQENPKACIVETYEECDSDADDMKSSVMANISAGMRSEVRDLLAEYFGSETALFWALYTSIWPNFNKPISEALENVVGLRDSDYEDVADPWLFVTDGWTDSADS